MYHTKTEFATARLPLILASASPHRKRLLEEAGIAFETILPDESAEDDRRFEESTEEYVRRLAFQKAKNVADRRECGIVIGCDTIVLCGEDVLEKPVDRADARRMIRQLRGQVHQVLSGLCLVMKDASREIQVLTETATTQLLMQPISDGELEAYLDTGIWQGKSGAFGYQDCTGWITILEGSESNVVGLPMEVLQRMLSP
ncbi:MAG: Maf family protein [Planctomycetaceae bacterium]|nr:Maf family protein [Planctomycetaceae bacterium]